jgi:hypothetical protein
MVLFFVTVLRETLFFLDGVHEFYYIQQPNIIFINYCLQQPFAVRSYQKPIPLAAQVLEHRPVFWVGPIPYPGSHTDYVTYRLCKKTSTALTKVIEIINLSGKALQNRC